MFCGECGALNPDANQFCRNCGKLLRKAASPARQVLTAPAPATVTPLAPAFIMPSGKKRHNWIGIASLFCGILSWILLTIPLALVAIIVGGFSLYAWKKKMGRIAFSAIAGIVIACLAVAVSFLIS